MACGCSGGAQDTSPTQAPPAQGSRSPRRPRNVNLDETFIVPDAVPQYFEPVPVTEDFNITPPRPGMMIPVYYEEDPDISYDDGYDDTETGTEVWSVYDKRSSGAQRYPISDKDNHYSTSAGFKNIPPGYKTIPDFKKMSKRFNFNVKQKIPNPCDKSFDVLNIHTKGSASRLVTTRQGQSRSDEEMSNYPRTMPNVLYGSETSLDTVAAYVDESEYRTGVRAPYGQYQQRTQSIKTRDVKVAPPRSTEPRTSQSCKKSPPSPMKMFDDAVNSELKKRMECNALDEYATRLVDEPCVPGPGRRSVTTKSSLSAIEAARSLHPDYYSSGLSEAVDKLAQAEAACRFDGAVKAAEEAAAAYPEGILAEEAAVAGVRGYQAELVDTIDEVMPGLKPIELVGYIGVTKPRT